MREVIITSILEAFYRKTTFLDGWSWFKFHNFGLALGMTLKLYTSTAKGLKTKFQKVLGTNCYVCRSYRKKLIGGLFVPPPPAPSHFGIGLKNEFGQLLAEKWFSKKTFSLLLMGTLSGIKYVF